MTTPDPFRALDGVDVPDRWDDVVDRAEHPAAVPVDLGARRALHRRPLLVAAAVLAVLAIGGVAVAAARDGSGDGTEQVTAAEDDGTTSTSAGTTSADDVSFFGQEWVVTRLVEDGVDRALVSRADDGRVLLRTGTTTRTNGTFEGEAPAEAGMATFESGSCTGSPSGQVVVDPDGRLAWTAGDPRGACLMLDGEVADQDAFVVALLSGGPTVVIEGRTLRISSGEDRLEASVLAPPADPDGDRPEVEPSDDEPTGEPGTTTTVPPASTTTMAPPAVEPEAPATTTTTRPSVELPPPGGSGSALGDAFFGRRWKVFSAHEGRTYVAFPNAVITATADQRIAVSGGCNDQGGAVGWEGDDHLVVTGDWVSTTAACTGPAAEVLLAQDEFFFRLFTGGVDVAIVPEGISLTGPSRSVVLVAA